MIQPWQYDTRIQQWGFSFRIEFGKPPEINPNIKYSFHAFNPSVGEVGDRVLVEGQHSWLVFEITDVVRERDPQDMFTGHVILVEQHRKIGGSIGHGGVGEMMYQREKPQPKPVPRPEPPEGEPLGKLAPSKNRNWIQRIIHGG